MEYEKCGMGKMREVFLGLGRVNSNLIFLDLEKISSNLRKKG